MDKPAFGYVAATVVASWAVHHMYMGIKVVKARKQYKISYPALYADASNCPDERARTTFNCIQRAHQNSLENQPIFLALLLTSGAKHPATAAAFGAAYLAGRIAYVQGYSTGDPEKRINPLVALNYVGLLGLMGTAIKIAVDMMGGK